MPGYYGPVNPGNLGNCYGTVQDAWEATVRNYNAIPNYQVKSVTTSGNTMTMQVKYPSGTVLPVLFTPSLAPFNCPAAPETYFVYPSYTYTALAPSVSAVDKVALSSAFTSWVDTTKDSVSTVYPHFLILLAVLLLAYLLRKTLKAWGL